MIKFKDFGDIRSDLTSGFVVFLLAVPLSLGIAMASGVPPVSGLIAAIIGGLVCSWLGGGHVSINGPAAGLIVVVVHAVDRLGAGDHIAGYRGLLAATVVSGLLLALAGLFLKPGKFGDLIPRSVVHGMLAAIGVIIIVKQLFVLMGIESHAHGTFGLMQELIQSVNQLNPEIALIGVISLLILIGVPLLPWKWKSYIPTPMVVVLVGIALGHYFDLEHQHKYLFLPEHEYSIGPQYLVSLPDQFLSSLVFPDFQAVFKTGFLGVLFTLSLVQGLESLLSASAVDQFDRKHRKTHFDRDLIGVGVGSAISGFLGGLPIITEIVRSRANVEAGASSWKANLFHGVLVLIFVAFFPSLIHQIPLAALAAILIVTGAKLASIGQLKHAYHVGRDQLAIFTVTLATTLATDLLIGVGTGVGLKIGLHLVRGNSLLDLFKPDFDFELVGSEAKVKMRRSLIFSNFIQLKEKLSTVPSTAVVEFNLDQLQFIDHTSLEALLAFSKEHQRNGGRVDWVGLDRMQPIGHHDSSARRASTGSAKSH